MRFVSVLWPYAVNHYEDNRLDTNKF